MYTGRGLRNQHGFSVDAQNVHITLFVHITIFDAAIIPKRDPQFPAGLFSVVRMARVELAQAYAHHPLKVACLPFHHIRFWFVQIFFENKSQTNLQNKTKRNRTKRNRTKRNKTERNKTERNKAKRNRTDIIWADNQWYSRTWSIGIHGYWILRRKHTARPEAFSLPDLVPIYGLRNAEDGTADAQTAVSPEFAHHIGPYAARGVIYFAVIPSVLGGIVLQPFHYQYSVARDIAQGPVRIFLVKTEIAVAVKAVTDPQDAGRIRTVILTENTDTAFLAFMRDKIYTCYIIRMSA